ncbi:hypothetical protein GCM10010211_35110 [Streptomyces albospinus]|uniref:Uncharacterized protein n=1 Tax=Streptomyces albospinus TaxID=285515 RepID=A0ABQ2V365_9ACTN|nr:hypothetical protein GCM10010211_35110 [Streptomyces albospinus]
MLGRDLRGVGVLPVGGRVRLRVRVGTAVSVGLMRRLRLMLRRLLDIGVVRLLSVRVAVGPLRVVPGVRVRGSVAGGVAV